MLVFGAACGGLVTAQRVSQGSQRQRRAGVPVDAADMRHKLLSPQLTFHVVARGAAGHHICPDVPQVVVHPVHATELLGLSAAVVAWPADELVKEAEGQVARQPAPLGLRFQHTPAVFRPTLPPGVERQPSPAAEAVSARPALAAAPPLAVDAALRGRRRTWARRRACVSSRTGRRLQASAAPASRASAAPAFYGHRARSGAGRSKLRRKRTVRKDALK